MITLPQIDPIALQLGPLPIRWYALAYIAAFILGNMYFNRINKRHPAPNLTPERIDTLFIYIVLGVILGGRLGFVLFYHLPYYLENPMDILKTWQGGMSFHGGLLGVTLAGLLFCWRYKIKPIDIADRLAVVAPIGLFFGRLANFINEELYGRATTLPWGMVFPSDPTGLPRHPSQLYEAGLEGLLLALILYALTRKGITRFQPTAIFLIGYGLARFGVEFVRQPDTYAYIEGLSLTSGQWLSLPMILVGAALLYKAFHLKNC